MREGNTTLAENAGAGEAGLSVANRKCKAAHGGELVVGNSERV